MDVFTHTQSALGRETSGLGWPGDVRFWPKAEVRRRQCNSARSGGFRYFMPCRRSNFQTVASISESHICGNDGHRHLVALGTGRSCRRPEERLRAGKVRNVHSDEAGHILLVPSSKA